MSTINTTITEEWSKIADDTDTEILISWEPYVTVEIAVTDNNFPPVIRGHMLTKDDIVTRNTIGAGFIWARLYAETLTSEIVLSVNKGVLDKTISLSPNSNEVSNQLSDDLLNEIIKQLKIMNFHLGLITNTTINKSDIT